jgi:hypothetical protein
MQFSNPNVNEILNLFKGIRNMYNFLPNQPNMLLNDKNTCVAVENNIQNLLSKFNTSSFENSYPLNNLVNHNGYNGYILNQYNSNEYIPHGYVNLLQSLQKLSYLETSNNSNYLLNNQNQFANLQQNNSYKTNNIFNNLTTFTNDNGPLLSNCNLSSSENKSLLLSQNKINNKNKIIIKSNISPKYNENLIGKKRLLKKLSDPEKCLKNNKKVYIVKAYHSQNEKLLHKKQFPKVRSKNAFRIGKKLVGKYFIIEKLPKKEIGREKKQKVPLIKNKRAENFSENECPDVNQPFGRGSKYRGVSKNGSQWQVLIMVEGKKRYVSSYLNEDDAARAYDKAAIQNHKLKAKTNFFYSTQEILQILDESPIINKTKHFS